MARIAIDARKLGDLGIGTHIEGLVGELALLDRTSQYSLLVPERLDLPVPAAGAENFRAVPCPAPKYSLAELWALPRQLGRLGAELFHSPHYVLPPRLPCPAVVTIHDLIHLRFPELLATPLHRLYARLMLSLAVRTARVVGQHALEALAHLRRSVGDDDLAGVERVADPDPAAMMERHP